MNHGCRCEPCVAAQRAADRRRPSRARASSAEEGRVSTVIVAVLVLVAIAAVMTLTMRLNRADEAEPRTVQDCIDLHARGVGSGAFYDANEGQWRCVLSRGRHIDHPDYREVRVAGKTRWLTGSVTFGAPKVLAHYGEGDLCSGPDFGSFSGIRRWATVSVRGISRPSVRSLSLRLGTASCGGFCRFQIKRTAVPATDNYYSVRVAHRREAWFSKDELNRSD